MNVVVTGGAGFLGSHVVERIGAEHDVTSLDLPSWDILHASPEHFRDVDAIVHCAAVPDPQGTDPMVWRVNVDGTRALLDAATQVQRIVFISSSCVYGDDTPVDGRRTELRELGPVSLYGATKLAGEALVSAWAARTSGTWAALRPVAIYGSRQPRGHINDFVARYRRDGSVKAFDTGQQRKAGVHVGDVADAVALLLAVGRGVYDISSQPWSWRDTADLMGIRVDAGGSVRGFIGDALRSDGFDCTKLLSLGWRARRSVRQGVLEALTSLGWQSTKPYQTINADPR